MGFTFRCTLAGLINIETCSRRSWKYSTSVISSITTTLPSAGQTIYFSLIVSVRAGTRKKDMIKSKNARLTINMNQLNPGK